MRKKNLRIFNQIPNLLRLIELTQINNKPACNHHPEQLHRTSP